MTSVNVRPAQPWISIADRIASSVHSGLNLDKVSTSDIIPIAAAQTLTGLFRERVRRSPDAIAYRDADPRTQRWRDHTWSDMDRRAGRLRAALTAAGLKAGDRVAIALPNGAEWVAFDTAALSLGLVVVPLYLHDSAAGMAFVLTHSGSRLLVVDTEARWRLLLPHWPELIELAHVWIRDGLETSDISRPGLVALEDALERAGGASLPWHSGNPDAVATIIYTSGTTGRPKGPMLTHRALLWNASAAAHVIPPRPDDVFLSCLPLAHAFERTVGCYLPMVGGATVAYARAIETLSEDFRSQRPTVFLGVPRLYERAAGAIHGGTRRNLLKRWLLHFNHSLGWRSYESRQTQHRDLGRAARNVLRQLDRWVSRKVLAAFGGRLRVAVSGGAPLPTDVARFLIGLGMPLVEGYGLTEAGPVVTTSRVGDYVPGSAGRPLEGVELKISARGELLVRSPSVMTGYWGDDKLTAETVDRVGWLHTGDIADISGGRVFIRGRLKELLVLSTGEKVAPAEIEARIVQDSLLDHALVVGDRKPFLAAVIALNAESWADFAGRRGLSGTEPNAPAVKNEVLRRLERRLQQFASHAQVRAVHLTLDTWTVANGLLTPTLKTKRGPLAEKYKGEIAALYASSDVSRDVGAGAG